MGVGNGLVYSYVINRPRESCSYHKVPNGKGLLIIVFGRSGRFSRFLDHL